MPAAIVTPAQILVAWRPAPAPAMARSFSAWTERAWGAARTSGAPS